MRQREARNHEARKGEIRASKGKQEVAEEGKEEHERVGRIQCHILNRAASCYHARITPDRAICRGT